MSTWDLARCITLTIVSFRCRLTEPTNNATVLYLVLFIRVSSSLTRPPPVPQAEKVCEWPENGGEWSDDDGPSMDCGLLQAMAEEDEEINVHNEETFGMGVCVKKVYLFPGCDCLTFRFSMRP